MMIAFFQNTSKFLLRLLLAPLVVLKLFPYACHKMTDIDGSTTSSRLSIHFISTHYLACQDRSCGSSHASHTLARSRLSGPLDSEKKDFMSYIRRWNDEKGMSVPEIESTFSVIILAGSESVGTAMTSVIHHLLKNPKDMRSLCNEIRGTFHTHHDGGTRRTAFPECGY